MIIVELKGGLGNQLFQYAAGLGLAKFHNVDLKVDISSLKSPDEVLGTYRKYSLSNLIIPPKIATDDEVNYLTGSKISQALKKVNILSKGVYKEKYFHYDPQFWKNGKQTYLKGNFQSEKYFTIYKNDIIESLKFNQDIIPNSVEDMLQIVKQTFSIAIHVRRGDYVSNKIANDVLGTLSPDYYEKAFHRIMTETDAENIFIFSDDTNWVRNNFSFISNAIFVNTTGENRDLIDFYLMQHCSHNIIANSSFSWWAAYLNPNPNKIVIAPQKWFNKAPYDTKDLIPESWIRI